MGKVPRLQMMAALLSQNNGVGGGVALCCESEQLAFQP